MLRTKRYLEKYALLSVFDKNGIVDFASSLIKLGYKIISTGGTAKILAQNNIKVIPIQEITGDPESFGGRMKTISFEIESGILFDRSNLSHIRQATTLNIKPIDIVVCNLYPFEKTIEDPKVSADTAIENIDVGGPTMIRAAAKNFKNVLVLTDPDDYDFAIEVLSRHSGERSDSRIDSGQARMTLIELKKSLAAKAFTRLSFYDSQVARFLNKKLFPEEITLPGRKTVNLRYGENPHQKAAFYLEPNTNSVLKNLTRISGRKLSLVNLTDINAGLESVRLFNESSAVIIKHNSPCGIALGKNVSEALKRAIEADSESAFGGIIVINKPMILKTARVIWKFRDAKRANIDIVAAPKITNDALEYLSKIRKSMGIYTFGSIPKKCVSENIKYVDGGFIIQTADLDIDKSFNGWKIATRKKPSLKEIRQMKIAWKFISRIRSNAVIVVDKDLPMTRGIGSGQTSRIRSVRIALEQAGKYSNGAILASDSFFPFDDSVKLAAKYRISAIVQQGGSINDKLSILAADKAGISMVFTQRRAFWH